MAVIRTQPVIFSNGNLRQMPSLSAALRHKEAASHWCDNANGEYDSPESRILAKR